MQWIVSCLQQCLAEEKQRTKEAEDSSVAYLDQIEELTHKLHMTESKIKAFEESKASEGQKVCVLHYLLNLTFFWGFLDKLLFLN